MTYLLNFQSSQKKNAKEEPVVEIEILDWWTRFYETLRDMEEEATPSKKKTVVDSSKDESGSKMSNVPRLKACFMFYV